MLGCVCWLSCGTLIRSSRWLLHDFRHQGYPSIAREWCDFTAVFSVHRRFSISILHWSGRKPARRGYSDWYARNEPGCAWRGVPGCCTSPLSHLGAPPLTHAKQPCVEKTKVSGASAGALLAASVQCGMNADAVTEWCLRLMDDCRRFGTSGRLGVRRATMGVASLSGRAKLARLLALTPPPLPPRSCRRFCALRWSGACQRTRTCSAAAERMCVGGLVVHCCVVSRGWGLGACWGSTLAGSHCFFCALFRGRWA